MTQQVQAVFEAAVNIAETHRRAGEGAVLLFLLQEVLLAVPVEEIPLEQSMVSQP